ncbi:MAG TPA: hypothetical protein VFL14_08335 [Xanthomonadales bacterium]|nr:hypothetical protein [Xanthomonadales bacterium]
MSTKLHVGNLESRTTAATLTDLFRRDGRQVLSVDLVMSRDAGHSRGFAFVLMATAADAAAAVEALHGTDLAGRALRVNVAHPPKSRFGGTRGRSA